MKEIKAIIQPFMLMKVIDALEEIPDLPGITVSDVYGYGKSEDGKELVRNVQKVKLEIMVSASMAEDVIERLLCAAHTGNPGDGKIFVIDIAESIKIRTGERDSEAI